MPLILSDWGPMIEHDPLFPERVNVNVATVMRDRLSLKLRVWERGVGHTRACGTGACATAVAAIRHGLVSRLSRSACLAETLMIDWQPGGSIIMTGPATYVFHWRNRLEPLRMSGAEVISFGCRLNIAEGEAIRAAAGRIRMI